MIRRSSHYLDSRHTQSNSVVGTKTIVVPRVESKIGVKVEKGGRDREQRIRPTFARRRRSHPPMATLGDDVLTTLDCIEARLLQLNEDKLLDEINDTEFD